MLTLSIATGRVRYADASADIICITFSRLGWSIVITQSYLRHLVILATIIV